MLEEFNIKEEEEKVPDITLCTPSRVQGKFFPDPKASVSFSMIILMIFYVFKFMFFLIPISSFLIFLIFI